jgi:thiamine-phosphate pyrophosphorylase
MIPDRFYPILEDARWLERLLPAGIRFVQLRNKELEGAELRREIREARRLCEDAGARLVVNDHWREALAEGVDFVHLGQEDLAAADREALQRAGVALGVSTHDEEELETALAAAPDYIALGPIYPTRLKVMPWAPQGTERIAAWKRRIGRLPLVAIGGLTVERVPEVLAAGADALAVVTDLTLHRDPPARVREWREATR